LGEICNRFISERNVPLKNKKYYTTKKKPSSPFSPSMEGTWKEGKTHRVISLFSPFFTTMKRKKM